jgi:hypothetical protein
VLPGRERDALLVGLQTYIHRHHLGLIALSVALVALAAPAIASNVVLIGRVAAPGLGACSGCNVLQLKTEGQPSYKVPKGKWELKAWSAQGSGSADGEARLLVFRRTATPGQFKLIGSSDLETVPADDSPFFATAIQVKGGDRLGIQTYEPPSASTDTGNDGDVAKGLACYPDPGQRVGAGTDCALFQTFEGRTVNVEAKLRPG